MIKATFEHLEEHHAYVASIKGHAGFDELGKDVVCAGASMYAMGLAESVMQMRLRGKLIKAPTVRIKGGDVFLVAKPRPEHEEELAHYFYMAQVGLRLLEAAYPANVSLKSYAVLSADGNADMGSSTDGQDMVSPTDGQEE